jgi:hypothetical protein
VREEPGKSAAYLISSIEIANISYDWLEVSDGEVSGGEIYSYPI